VLRGFFIRAPQRTEDAFKTKSPQEALRWLSRLTKFAAIAGTGMFATFAGINEGLDLIERLNGGQPIDEIIRDLRRDKKNENHAQKANAKTSYSQCKQSK